MFSFLDTTLSTNKFGNTFPTLNLAKWIYIINYNRVGWVTNRAFRRKVTLLTTYVASSYLSFLLIYFLYYRSIGLILLMKWLFFILRKKLSLILRPLPLLLLT
jgi:hypothetical protein